MSTEEPSLQLFYSPRACSLACHIVLEESGLEFEAIEVRIADGAHKNPEYLEAFFGGLDSHRIEFTRGRDIPLPGAVSEPLNYSIYPHVEVDGRAHSHVETEFSFRAGGST